MSADFKRVIPTDVDLIGDVVEEALIASGVAHWGDAQAFRFRMGLSEALVNAMRHGNGLNSGKSVRLELVRVPGRVEARVRDEGSGFDHGSLPNPTEADRLGATHGRGVFLMRNLCDELSFNDRGNEVVLTLRRSAGGDPHSDGSSGACGHGRAGSDDT